jgi:hypothetical protein
MAQHLEEQQSIMMMYTRHTQKIASGECAASQSNAASTMLVSNNQADDNQMEASSA